MTAWWDSLSLLQQILATVAMPASIILVIQVILLLVGIGHDGMDTDGADTDVDTDVDADTDTDTETELQGHYEGHAHPDAGLDAINQVSVFSLEGLRLMTFRGIIAFLAIFGWTGVALLDTGLFAILALPLAALAGFLASYLLAVCLRAASRLQEDGTLDMNNAIGKVGVVYIPIPPNKEGVGKVTLTVQGSLIEADAITYGPERLATGAEVTVLNLENSALVVTENLKP